MRCRLGPGGSFSPNLHTQTQAHARGLGLEISTGTYRIARNRYENQQTTASKASPPQHVVDICTHESVRECIFFLAHWMQPTTTKNPNGGGNGWCFACSKRCAQTMHIAASEYKARATKKRALEGVQLEWSWRLECIFECKHTQHSSTTKRGTHSTVVYTAVWFTSNGHRAYSIGKKERNRGRERESSVRLEVKKKYVSSWFYVMMMFASLFTDGEWAPRMI